MKEQRTILVTGAAGFIGFHLAKRILEHSSGVRVVGIDDMNDYYDVSLKQSRLDILAKHDAFHFVRGSIADEALVNRCFADYQPEIVVNLAAQAGVRYSIENPRAYIQSNVVGFFNILEACRAAMASGTPFTHLLFASSSSVYGNQQKTPFSIDDPVDSPVSLYAATKKSDELMAYTYSHLYGIPATGLRFFTVYGPYGRPDMAYFSFTKKILAGEPIKIFNHGDMYRDFTYIGDIVSCIMKMLHHPPVPNASGDRYRLYNIGNNRPEKLMTFIETLESCLGKTAQKEYLPMQPGDVYQTYADVGELEKDFGFKPATGIKDGLEAFVAWYTAYYRVKNAEA